MTWIARHYGFNTRFIELAGEVNTSMPAYVVSKVVDALNERDKPLKGSKLAILGMAYKEDVDDPRESPGFELMDLLFQKGAVVTYNSLLTHDALTHDAQTIFEMGDQGRPSGVPSQPTEAASPGQSVFWARLPVTYRC